MKDPLNDFRLTNRTAVVSGGAGLLGMEFCKTLAAAGAAVIVADIDKDKGQELADSLVEEGHQAQFFHLDVTEKTSCEDLVGFVADRHDSVDVLVNSAALDPKFDPNNIDGQVNDFETYPSEAWEAGISVNLTGMFLLTQAVVGSMREKKRGSIVNICSTYGLAGPDQRIYQRPGEPARFKPVYYPTTKAGVLGFTRYLAAYYAGTMIRVNALTPGGVFADHDEEFVQAYSARTILGRMARQDEMNGALLFLASDASSYMTGANLVVDGGWTAW